MTKLKELAKWDEGQVIKTGDGMIKAKGMGCFGKHLIRLRMLFLELSYFNTDGSINLNTGAVEIGPSTKTTLAQILD